MMLSVTLCFGYGCSEQVKDERLSQKFSDLEKLYFAQTAFDRGEYNIVKWQQGVITYSISGVFKQRDVEFINNTVLDLQAIPGLPKFQLKTGDADIVFYMPPAREEVQKLGHGSEVRGNTRFLKKNGSIVRKVKISVDPTQDPYYTQVTIQHELMHAIGLIGHPKSFFKQSTALGSRGFTLETLSDTISPRIPALDSAALLLLYDRSVVPDMNKKDVLKLIGFINGPVQE